MKTVCKENMCSGCMSCLDICPKHAINIVDTVKEFNAVIDETKCVNCNLCHNVCQVNYTPTFRKPVVWFEGWANEFIRKNSSSGGVATAFILSFEGVVCSCVFRDGEFLFEFDEGDRRKFAGSKYIKSSPLGAYNSILKKLKEGIKVLFIGLPCQCAAIINYTKNHKYLYTIDLVCHGSPSPKLLELYLREKGLDIKKIPDLRFRMKSKFGLYSEYVDITPARIVDLYTFAFLNCLDYTENCYSCNYAKLERVSDITIGDSWSSELDASEQIKGISLILCQTNKGKELINKTDLTLKNVDLNRAVQANHQLDHPSIAPKQRKRFFAKLQDGFDKAISKVYPKFYYKQRLKVIMIKLGLLNNRGGVKNNPSFIFYTIPQNKIAGYCY